MEEKENKENKSAFTTKQRRIILFTCMIICAGLAIAGFIVPPVGHIDGSVITTIGELGGFTSFMCGLETNWGNLSLRRNKDE